MPELEINYLLFTVYWRGGRWIKRKEEEEEGK